MGAEALVERAADFAKAAHAGQKRRSGEEYFEHVNQVFGIMKNEWRISDETLLAAGFLHDTVEDTETNLEQIYKEFGEEVGFLVDGVTSLVLDRDTERKGAKAAFADNRVLVLKLADRLHNMRTMGVMPPEKARAKAEETLKVYVPMAEAVGLWVVKKELEDLAFKYFDPEGYFKFEAKVRTDPRLDHDFLRYMSSTLEQVVGDMDGPSEVEIGTGGLWRLKKVAEKRGLISPAGETDLRTINDLVSFRVIVDGGWDQAYAMIGRIHEHYGNKEMLDMGRYDDFGPGNERLNGYSALQTTINTPRGAVEVAVVTREAEEFNNWGLVTSLRGAGAVAGMQHYERMKYVFTPGGDVKWLPETATAWDFAYLLIPSLGASAVEVTVDGQTEPMSVVLPNASEVYVRTAGVKLEPETGVEDYCLPVTRKIIEIQRESAKQRLAVVRGADEVDEMLAQKHLPNLDWFMDQALPALHMTGVGEAETLYMRIGSGSLPGLLDKFAWALQATGITRESLGVTTLRVEGRDVPGTLATVSARIGELGGNIVSLISTSDQTTGEFKLVAVVSGLDEAGERLIEEYLGGCDWLLRLRI